MTETARIGMRHGRKRTRACLLPCRGRVFHVKRSEAVQLSSTSLLIDIRAVKSLHMINGLPWEMNTRLSLNLGRCCP